MMDKYRLTWMGPEEAYISIVVLGYKTFDSFRWRERNYEGGRWDQSFLTDLIYADKKTWSDLP